MHHDTLRTKLLGGFIFERILNRTAAQFLGANGATLLFVILLSRRTGGV